ncbi:MAG TPA: Ku protein [Cytophagaceae bacterium]|jgi:DNA end-binding protein Ku|nr:Ku protein [Cytophagaceae bacterium]
MRSIWSGAISFGLVNIPVKLYSAVGDNKLNFDMLSKKDLSPIKYVRISSADGKEVSYKDIVKGYEIAKDQYVVMDDKDFEKANVKKSRSIEIISFVLEEEIDSIFFDKPYYLEPDKTAEKPYALLREALRQSKKVGIATFVLHNREHMAIIKPEGDLIILNQMRYEADIRDPKGLHLPEAEKVSKAEVEMAKKLIEQLTEKFNPSKFKDTYIEELKNLIEAKAEGKTIESKTSAPAPTHMKDLMETLKASLDKSPKNRPPVSRKKAARKKVKK